MTDGVQRVVGIEYQPITALRNLFPAGLKVGGQFFLAISFSFLEWGLYHFFCGYICKMPFHLWTISQLVADRLIVPQRGRYQMHLPSGLDLVVYSCWGRL